MTKKKKKKNIPDAVRSLPDLHLGLSSAVHKRYATEILENSTSTDIAKLLKKVHFNRTIRTRPPLDKNLALAEKVLRYLASSEGKKKFKQKQAEALQEKIKTWLNSTEGCREFDKLKADLLEKKLADDNDIFQNACLKRINVKIDRWIQSPFGRDAVEQARNTVIKAISADEQPAPQGWVKDVIREIDGEK